MRASSAIDNAGSNRPASISVSASAARSAPTAFDAPRGEQPIGGDTRRLRPDLGGSGTQGFRGVEVASDGSMHEMVGAQWQRRTRARELTGGGGMAGEPRPRAEARVDRAAHDRMAKRESPHRPRTDEAGPLERIQRGERLLVVEAGDARGEVELEGIADHRRGLGEALRRCWQRGHLDAHRGDNPTRQELAAAVARQLVEQQWISSRRMKHAVGVLDAREQRLRGRPCQRGQVERERLDRARRGDEPVRFSARPQAECEAHRSGGRTADEMLEELQRRGVGPVHIVNHQEQRASSRDVGQARREGAMHPPAFRRERRDGRRAERVENRHERHIALELGRVPRQHNEPHRLRPSTQRREQQCLPDPRLAAHEHEPHAAARDRVERTVERLELAVASKHRRRLFEGFP